MDTVEKLLLSKHALSVIATLIGSVAVFASIWGLNHFEGYRRFLRDTPRNKTWARWLLVVNIVWSAPLTANFLQSMEFPDWTRPLVYFLVAPAVLILILFYVDQYLGARMVGWTLILAAKPILYACLVRDEPSKLILVVLAYYWIIAGMIMIAAPHFFRDLIALYLDKPLILRRSLKMKGICGAAFIAIGLLVY